MTAAVLQANRVGSERRGSTTLSSLGPRRTAVPRLEQWFRGASFTQLQLQPIGDRNLQFPFNRQVWVLTNRKGRKIVLQTQHVLTTVNKLAEGGSQPQDRSLVSPLGVSPLSSPLHFGLHLLCPPLDIPLPGHILSLLQLFHLLQLLLFWGDFLSFFLVYGLLFFLWCCCFFF